MFSAFLQLKVEVIRYSLYSLLAICATTIANDQCATATDSLLAIYATMNIWLVAYQSLTDTLHIYILTFTLQFFPSMERNLSKDAKHRLRLNNEARYSPTYLFPICFHNVVTQDLWDEYPFQVHVYNITTFLFVNFKSCQIMSLVSHANKMREYIVTSIYYQCSV